MTFQEWNLSIMKHPILGKLLPLECRRTFPRLELNDNSLCASFVGFRMKPGQEGIEIRDPSFYLKISYPQCAVQAFLKFSGGTSRWHLMTPQSPECIRTLAESCNRVLARYDEKAEDLGKVIADYNSLLANVLEPEQLAVLDKMAQL